MNPLTWLSGTKTYLIVGGFVVLGAAVGVQSVRLAGAKTETANVETKLAGEQRDRAQERSDRNRAALRDSERVAALMSTHAATQQENVSAFNREKSLRLAAESERRTADDQLRYVISAFTAGDRNKADGDPAACRDQRDRSERLGGLLGEAVGLASEGESLVRQRDGEVILLLGTVRADRALIDGAAQAGHLAEPAP